MRRLAATAAAALIVTAAAIAGCGRVETPTVPDVPMRAPGSTASSGQPATALEKQAKQAIDRGLKFLHSKLLPDGSWDKNPGVTGLAVLAVLKSGRGYNDVDDPFVRRPVEYLLSLQKSDGGIYDQELANYTTSLAVQVLVATKNPKHQEPIAKARAFLLGNLLDEPEGYQPSDPGYGGEGYSSTLRPDLSNTQTWADAMRELENSGLEKDSEAWRKTVLFVSRCQNRSESNDMPTAGDDGSGVYSPWESKAGEYTMSDGRKGLRGYGAMTYAFLKTMIYADVRKDDPRVKAAYDWIRKHYSVDENPELGTQGLFYYYHTMAKALKALGDPALVDDKGVSHDWRVDLMKKVLSLQNPDGSWVNKNDRWWESNATLVSAYAVLTLEELLEK